MTLFKAAEIATIIESVNNAMEIIPESTSTLEVLQCLGVVQGAIFTLLLATYTEKYGERTDELVPTPTRL